MLCGMFAFPTSFVVAMAMWQRGWMDEGFWAIIIGVIVTVVLAPKWHPNVKGPLGPGGKVDVSWELRP